MAARRTLPPATASAGLAGRYRTGVAPNEFATEVLAAVQRIPRGKVMTYGDVAEFCDKPGRSRLVGNVLAQYGHEVSWWRVLKSTGEPSPHNVPEALRLLRKDKTPMRPGGERVDLKLARWDGR
jgi:methylated-DNA-protein-cysteine methyltransferase related protein